MTHLKTSFPAIAGSSSLPTNLLSPQFCSGVFLSNLTGPSQWSNDWVCVSFKHFRCTSVTFPFHRTKFPRSTSSTRAISLLSPITLRPQQTFLSWVLLLRRQAFQEKMRCRSWSPGLFIRKSSPREADDNNYCDKNKVFMFRYERPNSTRKFTIVAEIVSLLKKIYERDAPFRAVFKVKTLAVLFPPYPGELKTNTAKFKSAAILSLAFFLWKWCNPFPARSMCVA